MERPRIGRLVSDELRYSESLDVCPEPPKQVIIMLIIYIYIY